MASEWLVHRPPMGVRPRWADKGRLEMSPKISTLTMRQQDHSKIRYLILKIHAESGEK